MVHFVRMGSNSRLMLSFLLLTMLLGVVPVYVAVAQTTTYVEGIIRLDDRTLC